MVNGVAQVKVFGPQKYAVRIDVDPRKLSAHGIGIDEVVTAVQSSNVNLPTGTMAGRERNFTVLADGQLLNAAAYAPMVIAYRNSNPVRLGDVARVYDGVEQDKTASWYQGSATSRLRSRNSRDRTSCRSSTRSRHCCRTFAHSCHRRFRSTSESIGRSRSANRSTTSS